MIFKNNFFTDIPQVSLQLIKEFPDRQPKEDDYVRLICEIDSNPPVVKVGWLFNDHPISHNKSHTDIINRNTLVFKRLSRHNAGRYKCYGINSEGRGMSSEMILDVSRKFILITVHKIKCTKKVLPHFIRWDFLKDNYM